MRADRRRELKSRISVSFSLDQFRALSAMARTNGVSKAWIVRHAVREFVDAHKDQQLRLKFEHEDRG